MSEDKFKLQIIIEDINRQIVDYRIAHYGEAPEHVILNMEMYKILKHSRKLYEKGIFVPRYNSKFGSVDSVYGLKIAIIQQEENIIKVC